MPRLLCGILVMSETILLKVYESSKTFSTILSIQRYLAELSKPRFNMKFAHSFDAALRQEDFPLHWEESAISYRQLKKCIKKVQQDLFHIGTIIASRTHLRQTTAADTGRGRMEHEVAGRAL